MFEYGAVQTCANLVESEILKNAAERKTKFKNRLLAIQTSQLMTTFVKICQNVGFQDHDVLKWDGGRRGAKWN